MAQKKPLPSAQPNAEEDNISLSKFAGIKNTVRAERLGPDELELAINVDLDDVGQLSRRRGYEPFGNWTNQRCHSLFTEQGGMVFVAAQSGSAYHLVWVKPDGHSVGANTAIVSADPISYAQIGPQIYYSSRSANGIIDVSGPEPTYGPWGTDPDFWYSPVVNPTATLPAIRGALLGKPPQAEYITYSNGRIYLAQGNVVWFTLLFDYNHTDRTQNFWQFEGPVTMLGSTTEDIYVGTTEGLWFVSGTAKEPKRVRVLDSGVVPGSLVYVPAEIGNPALMQKGAPGSGQDTSVQVSLLFMTHKGYCGGQDGGVVYNYTEEKVIFPHMDTAAAMFRRQDGVNQYVVAASSGGSPSANTRIGDYVDAEIRRGGASWNTLAEVVSIGDVAEAVIA